MTSTDTEARTVTVTVLPPDQPAMCCKCGRCTRANFMIDSLPCDHGDHGTLVCGSHLSRAVLDAAEQS